MEIISNKNHIVAESPLWDEKKGILYFVDILGKCFYKMDYKTRETVKIDVPQQLGCMALCEDGDLILSMEDGIYFMDSSNHLTLAHDPIKIKGRRFNDGKVGPDGRYYVGTVDDNGHGAFYCLHHGILEELFDSCICSNGLDWNACADTLYYTDSQKHQVEKFDFSSTKHNVSNRCPILDIPEDWGVPDGMTIDSQGNLWLAVWGGSCLLHINPSTKEIIERIEFPVEKISSCCFAGEDLKDLIVTTASVRSELSQEPLAGNVFRIRTETPGATCNRYIK